MKIKLYVNTRPELSAGIRGNDFTFEVDTDLDEDFREDLEYELKGAVAKVLECYDISYIMTEEEMENYIESGG